MTSSEFNCPPTRASRSENTLEYYDNQVRPFLAWSADAGVHRFADLEVGMVVAYRAQEAARIGKHGRKLRPHTVQDAQKALSTFLRWAKSRKYELDPDILELKRPRVPKPEADVFHMSQLGEILVPCNRDVPQEELMVRILSLTRGRVELRVRWDAGAEGEEVPPRADHAEAGGRHQGLRGPASSCRPAR